MADIDNLKGGTKRTVDEQSLDNLRGGTKRTIQVNSIDNSKGGVKRVYVVGGGAPAPTGTIYINSNGTYDVTDKAEAVVNVPTSGPAHYIEMTNTEYGLGKVGSFIDLTGVSIITTYGLAYEYYGRDLSEVNIPASLSITLRERAMYYTFYGCAFTNKNVILSGIANIGNNGLSNTFAYSDIETLIVGATTIGNQGCNQMCIGCRHLTSVSYPNVSSIQSNGLGTFAYYDYAFQDCNALTEIHFPAAMQSTVEGLSGYADKWGASNATIYFDL